MKTSIAHNNNVSLSKGILISAYIHNSAAYVLLDGNRGYILRAENQEEEERIAAFVDQLQIGAYVFAYLTYNGRIMKLFDMLSGMELDCEDAGGEPDETETFSGRLKFKTKEFLRPQYEVYTLGVIADNELRCYAYLVDVTQQEKERRSLTKLQAGDAVAVVATAKGFPVEIEDFTRRVKVGGRAGNESENPVRKSL